MFLIKHTSATIHTEDIIRPTKTAITIIPAETKSSFSSSPGIQASINETYKDAYEGSIRY